MKLGRMNRLIEREIMAELNARFAENVAGAFYVSTACIDCDMCRETAPTVFRRNDEIGYSIVFRQPETELERAQAIEALEGCPTEAIGANGARG